MSPNDQIEEDFLNDVIPPMEFHKVDELNAILRQKWPPNKLVQFLDTDHHDAVKAALVCLALTGRLSETPAVAHKLHDSDTTIVSYAEYSLWSIWFRASSEEEVSILLNRAIHLLEEECTNEAIELLNHVIEISPDFAEAYDQRAIARFLVGEYQQAIEDYQRAIILNPLHFGALAGLGHCYASQEVFSAALEAYQKALLVHPRMEGVRQSIEYVQQCQQKLGMAVPSNIRPASTG